MSFFVALTPGRPPCPSARGNLFECKIVLPKYFKLILNKQMCACVHGCVCVGGREFDITSSYYWLRPVQPVCFKEILPVNQDDFNIPPVALCLSTYLLVRARGWRDTWIDEKRVSITLRH